MMIVQLSSSRRHLQTLEHVQCITMQNYHTIQTIQGRFQVPIPTLILLLRSVAYAQKDQKQDKPGKMIVYTALLKV